MRGRQKRGGTGRKKTTLALLGEVGKASLKFWHLNWFLKDGQ